MNAPHDIADFLPSSIDAEQALLGAVLMQNDAFFVVSEILRAEMFYEGLHQKLWEIIEARITAGHTVTPLMLITTLGKDAEALIDGQLTVAKYLVRLAVEATTVIGAPEYAKTIRDLWTRRRLINLSRDLIQRASGGFDDEGVEALLDEADGELCSIRFGKQIVGVSNIGEFADKALAQTAEAYRSTAKVGFDTGISSIDSIMGPIMPSDLVTLIAPSGGGKSALAAQILVRNCEPSLDSNRGVAALFVSQEMSGSQVARRALATHTGISTRKQRAGEIMEAEHGFLRDAADRLKPLPFYVDESGRQTTTSIIRKLRAMKKRYGIKIAAVDHLLLIRPEMHKWSKFDTIEHAAMELKDAAKDLEIAIILLAQVTRESQKRETWKVRDQDLWGGDVVKQCSDILMTLTMPEKWLRQREPEKTDKTRGQWEADCLRWEGKAEIGFPKVRDGQDGQSCVVSFSGERMLFGD